MSEVFLSYKAEDRARLKPLVAALEADGCHVWWDAHIGGGADWREDIQDHLDRAHCVIVAWSEQSVGHDGRFVRDEATRALRRNAYIAICIDAVEPPLGFGELQAIPFQGWKGNRKDPRYRVLLTAVRARLAGEAPPPLPTGLAPPSISRRAAIAGGVTGLAAVVGGGWLLLKSGSAAASDSIAVLPFANLSGDPAQAYFSDGIAEELRSALTRIAQLKVIGRTSSEAMRDADTKVAAKKLGVANILAGSVRKSPTTIRINAQLVSGTTGIERWSETYNRAPGDALEIQSSIAESVAGALSIQLGRVEKAALTLGGTANAAARDLYLKAEAAQNVAGDEADYRKILELLDSAIAIDANYAAAHAGRSRFLRAIAVEFAATPDLLRTGVANAVTSATRGIALAPDFAPGYSSLGLALQSQLAFGRALDAQRKAYQLSPGDSYVVRVLAETLGAVGKAAESLRLADRSVTLDPLDAGSYSVKARCLYWAGRFAPSAAAAQHALALAPTRTAPQITRASILILLDRPEEALAELDKGELTDWARKTVTAIARARMADRAAADRALAAFEAIDDGTLGYQFAQIRAQRREIDQAFAALNQAVEARDPGLYTLPVDPFLDPLRRDPRYDALLKRLKFP